MCNWFRTCIHFRAKMYVRLFSITNKITCSPFIFLKQPKRGVLKFAVEILEKQLFSKTAWQTAIFKNISFSQNNSSEFF